LKNGVIDEEDEYDMDGNPINNPKLNGKGSLGSAHDGLRSD